MKKTVLGIAGEMASGKGTATKYLQEKYAGVSYRFSTVLRDVAKRMYLEENRENLQKISTIFRENFYEDILSFIIAKDVEKDESQVIIVDGVRRLADVSHLKKISGFKLVYIEASMEKRYARIRERRENVDDEKKTMEEFRKDHEQEAEMQVKDLKKEADFVVDNSGSFEELYSQLDSIIRNFS